MLYRRQTQSSTTLVQIMEVIHQSPSLLHRSVQLLCPYTSILPPLYKTMWSYLVSLEEELVWVTRLSASLLRVT